MTCGLQGPLNLQVFLLFGIWSCKVPVRINGDRIHIPESEWEKPLLLLTPDL